jgi:hypothetical protein
MYIPINNPQGGGADISSFSGEKSLAIKLQGLLLKRRQEWRDQ